MFYKFRGGGKCPKCLVARLFCRSGVPNLGYICLSEGVHLKLDIQAKNILMYYLFPNILNVKVLLKIQWIFVILLSRIYKTF